MATKKAKKTSKSNKKRKNNNSSNIFSKVIVILLLISVLIAASIMAFNQIKNNIKLKDKKVEEHEEIVIVKQEDIKETSSEAKPSSSDNKPSQEEEKKPHQEDRVISQEKKETVKNDNDDEIIDIKDAFKKKQTINGFWLSMNQGVSLTMDEYGYRIDYFGIDASKPMTGKYEVEGNQLIFTSDDGVCKNEKGIYKVTFSDKNISLRCKSDECNKRKNVLETEWEWMEL